MKKGNFASTTEDLQREIDTLRQQSEELKRLASFPQHNPISIFEYDLQGKLVYLNPAASQTLAKLNLPDGRSFLPDEFLEKCRAIPDDATLNSFQEMGVEDHYFEETIFYSPDYATIRIYATDITQRRQAEVALKRSKQELSQTQEFLEAVTGGTDVIIATIDVNYCYTYFNQAYREEIKMLSGKDIQLGMSMIDVFTHLPGLQKTVIEEWNQVFRGESTNKILTFGDPSIYRKTYNVLHTPIWDDQHKVAGAGEVAFNISEQVRIQAALQESESRYRSLFDGMTEGFAVHQMIYDENGNPSDYRFLDINPAFERLTGLKRDQVIGKNYRTVLPGEGDRWINYYGKVVTTGQPTQFEEYAPTLDRYYEIFAYRCAPDQFATIFLDVTERRKMEEDLRANLTRYSVLFNTLPLGVTITDQKGRILESNQEAKRILGLSEKEMRRRLIKGEEWKIIRPDKTTMPVEEYASVRAMQEQRRIEDVEMGIVKKNNEVTWISVTAAPLPLKDFGVVITYNDITRRILAEEALHKAHEGLERTVQQRTQELQEANAELKAEIEERNRVTSQLVLQTQAVDAQRKRFNDVLEILPVYTILLTADYHVAFANKYFRERFGEDQGQRCYEYLFGRSEPCEVCETYKVLQNKDRLRWEWIGPDRRNYDVFDFPFNDVDGSDLILELGIDITDRKQAEEKLRLLNAYNRSLIEANLDALVTITPSGKIGDVNTVTEAITGYPRQELIGTDFHSYFTDPHKARLGYERVFETGTVRDYELEIQHRDGHTTPVVYNASVYRDETGKVAGILAAARDITERKQAELELQRLNAYNRSLIEASLDALATITPEGKIGDVNSVTEAITGYDRKELIGKDFHSYFSDPDKARAGYQHVFETGMARDYELEIQHKDGHSTPVTYNASVYRDETGRVAGVFAAARDITDRKRAEEALRKSEQQFRSLVIATSQIVWQTNALGEVVEDIPMWRDYTGQSLEECLGWGWLNAVHPDDQKRVAEIWARAVETKSFYETECRLRNRSNVYGDFAIRGVPITDKSGNITSWMGTSTDITEKKNYENQLIQAEKHAVIGRMVGSVTHEINNPLQTIKNCLYLIEQDTALDPSSKEPLEMALSETQRLSNIVGQLRQLYRPQLPQTMQTRTLNSILAEVHSLISHHLANSLVVWKLSAGSEDVSISCVREQIIEVFLNICNNAIEAMQPAGGTLAVSLVYSNDKNKVGVIFSDSGQGIKPEILPHIFEPFITTKELGLGLGLSICYGIVQKHGGQITVESQPGQGSKFTVWLPMVS